jgi:hypothetical protein
MDEQENKTTEGTEASEEKKEGKISGFFKKMGKKLDDATYDFRLMNDYTSNHKKYSIYSGTSALSAVPEIPVEEHLDEGYVVTPSDYEQIAAGNLIKNDKGDVMHIASTEATTITVEFEGKTNEKPAIKIVLGDKAVKVDVIKVGDDFYLKK